jgi:hypothetical protein
MLARAGDAVRQEQEGDGSKKMKSDAALGGD